MVRYNPKEWWGLIFTFHKSDTFRQLFWAMFSIAVFCGILSYLVVEMELFSIKGTNLLHSLLGFVISLLLVFRTNTAYDRWWEGRKLWGSLVNNTRNFALKIHVFVDKDNIELRRKFADLLTNYALALKLHLRGIKAPMIAPRDVHQPNYIAREIIEEIDVLYRSGKISGEQLIIINQEFQSFTDICGACERIKKTPIPYSYSMFLKKFIFAYIITMPFAFVNELGHFTALVVTFIFYVLASLELIAEEIEDPFGKDSNDLPLDEITRTIFSSTYEILGLPPVKAAEE